MKIVSLYFLELYNIIHGEDQSIDKQILHLLRLLPGNSTEHLDTASKSAPPKQVRDSGGAAAVATSIPSNNSLNSVFTY